jgi:hypothetical protein
VIVENDGILTVSVTPKLNASLHQLNVTAAMIVSSVKELSSNVREKLFMSKPVSWESPPCHVIKTDQSPMIPEHPHPFLSEIQKVLLGKGVISQKHHGLKF